ncbi:MAG: hypothetical protein RSD36_04780 [Terrisporobacter sp.]
MIVVPYLDENYNCLIDCFMIYYKYKFRKEVNPMTDMNEFNISEEELEEIQSITELAQGCTDYLIDSLVNPVTSEKIELEEDAKKAIFKLVLHKTMEFIEENSFPSDEENFEIYVNTVFTYVQENLA